jgi:hypothetical protein
MARTELGEGIDHLRQAATHAAGGVGATVGPRLGSVVERVSPGTDRMRDVASQGWGTTVAAITPLVDAARSGAAEANRRTAQARTKMTRKKKSRMSGRRTGMLVGLLAAGIAAGAAGAMVARRRSRSRWEEYESGGMSAAGDQAQSVLDSTRSAMDMAAGKSSAADMAGGRSGGAESAGGRSGGAESAGGRAGGADPAGGKSSGSGMAGAGSADKATAVTKNSRS